MIEGQHFQNAYVTRDLDAAARQLLDSTDVRRHVILESALEVTTPAGPLRQDIRLGLFWVDDVQYEYIQPLSNGDLYASAIRGDALVHFHHIAMRVADWPSFRRRVETLPYPVAIEGQHADIRFLYLDARTWCGHYLEYIYMPDADWERQGGRT